MSDSTILGRLFDSADNAVYTTNVRIREEKIQIGIVEPQTDEAQLIFGRQMVLRLATEGGTAPGEHTKTLTTFLTILVNLYPSFRDEILNRVRGIQFEYISVPLANLKVTLTNQETQAEVEYDYDSCSAAWGPYRQPITLDDEAIPDFNRWHLVAHLSLLLFSCVKEPTGRNETAFTEKRPAALVAMLKGELIREITMGAFKPQISAYKNINAAMALFPALRAAIFEEVITWLRVTGASVEFTIINSVTHLLQYYGITHVPLIEDLRIKYPAIWNSPALAAERQQYMADMAVVSKLPELYRPFVALLARPQYTGLMRKNSGLLTAVAVQTRIREGAATLRNYYVEPQNRALALGVIAQAGEDVIVTARDEQVQVQEA